MPKKDKQNAQPETPEKEPQAAAAEEKELPPEDKKEEAKVETFTASASHTETGRCQRHKATAATTETLQTIAERV